MSDIPSLADRIAASTVKAENASQIMHDVANGDAATEVPTESGPVPTINKWFADLNDRTSGAVGQVQQELDNEVLARQQADLNEAQAREQADQALAQGITDEAEARAQADQSHTQATNPHPQYLTAQSSLAQMQAMALCF